MGCFGVRRKGSDFGVLFCMGCRFGGVGVGCGAVILGCCSIWGRDLGGVAYGAGIWGCCYIWDSDLGSLFYMGWGLGCSYYIGAGQFGVLLYRGW